MELLNVLSDFFIRYGSRFVILSSKEAFFGRLVPIKSNDFGKSELSPLGRTVSSEYELTISGGFTLLKKGDLIKNNDKCFLVIAITEYTLNDKILYYHVLLHETGEAL